MEFAHIAAHVTDLLSNSYENIPPGGADSVLLADRVFAFARTAYRESVELSGFSPTMNP
jgi:hypothetical protein